MEWSEKKLLKLKATMSKHSALASLGSYSDNFTDSENEDDRKSDKEGSPITDASTESQVQIPDQPKDTPPPDTSQSSAQKKALRLVSYNDNLISDDEGDHHHSTVLVAKFDPNKKVDKATEYGFSLPPEPKGKCLPELQEKISILYEKMKNTNMDMNKIIQERKEFRNPSIYEKLIQYCNINEQGTNYPPELYDPLQWGTESFYEELARQQKAEMDRIEKDKKDKAKTILVLAAAAKVEEEAKKRKSKWDQPAPNASAQSSSVKSVPPTTASVQAVALTTNITGTKGTVIQAFGSLPKKPKV